MAEMLTPKADVQRPSWPLTDRYALLDALDELAPHGWRGFPSMGEDGTWSIELNHNSGAQIIAEVGARRLVLEPHGGLVLLDEADVPDFYDAVV